MSYELDEGHRSSEVSLLLNRLGDERDDARLFELVYEQLHRIAVHHMRKEAVGHTLQPTALVHEAYVRIAGQSDLKSSAHFFALASQAMRRLLVDHARRKKAVKRGAGHVQALSNRDIVYDENDPEKLLAIDEALSRLEKLDGRQAKVVEMRFFGGLSEDEVAQSLGVAVRTVKRDWAFAKAWLYDQLS